MPPDPLPATLATASHLPGSLLSIITRRAWPRMQKTRVMMMTTARILVLHEDHMTGKEETSPLARAPS